MTEARRDEVPAADLAERLTGEVEAVLRDLGLKGDRSHTSRSWIGVCPWSHPHARAEPKLYVDCALKKGAWIDWRSGEKGDLLWLIAMVRSGGVRSKGALHLALEWARDRYGVGNGRFDKAAWNRDVEAARQRNADEQRQAAWQLKKDRGKAFAQWLAASTLAPGQAGYDYLKARGIDFDRLGRMPRAIRYAGAAPYFEDGRPIYTGPALLTCMTLPSGKVGALHRTWIDPDRPGEKIDLGHDGRDKARPARKMWPETYDCVMRLWRGDSGLSEAQAVANGLIEDVVICEGVEDGLSLAMIAPERRIIAAGSLSGLLNMTPPACADALTIAADNDWGKPQAQAQLDRAVRRFRDDFQLKVKVRHSPVGKDFNDLIRPKA